MSGLLWNLSRIWLCWGTHSISLLSSSKSMALLQCWALRYDLQHIACTRDYVCSIVRAWELPWILAPLDSSLIWQHQRTVKRSQKLAVDVSFANWPYYECLTHPPVPSLRINTKNAGLFTLYRAQCLTLKRKRKKTPSCVVKKFPH